MGKKQTPVWVMVKRRLQEYSRLMNATERVLPDFLIIGTAKGGTTSLFNYLLEHPAVAAPLKKEISFFSKHHRKGINWYRLHFPLRKSMHAKITGEASPYYLSHPLAAERAVKLLPHAKIIVLLRNPIDRAFSSYKHITRIGYENESFEKAIALEPERINGEEEKILHDGNYFSLSHQYHSYLNRGIYWKELKNWFRFYPRDRFLILNSENFYNDPGKTYSRVLQFLGLEPWMPEKFSVYNKSGDELPLSGETRARLSEYFKPHNEKLFNLIGERYNWD